MKVGATSKRCLLYFFYTIGIIVFGLAGNELARTLKEQYVRHLIDPAWVVLSIILYPILIGILFAVPSFFKQLRKPGKWRIDWAKLIGIGLPTLIVALIPFIYYDLYAYLPRGATQIARHLGAAGTLQIICGTVFGYLLLSVFRKDSSNNTPEDGGLSPGGSIDLE